MNPEGKQVSVTWKWLAVSALGLGVTIISGLMFALSTVLWSDRNYQVTRIDKIEDHIVSIDSHIAELPTKDDLNRLQGIVTIAISKEREKRDIEHDVDQNKRP